MLPEIFCRNFCIDVESYYRVGTQNTDLFLVSGVAMSGEIVKLKGSKQGLQLVFAPDAAFDDIKADIRNKLEEGSRFFRRGTVIQIAPNTLSAENEGALRKLFHQHGVLFRVEDPAEELPKPAPKRTAPKKNDAPPPAPPEQKQPVLLPIEPAPEEKKLLVINRTVRGGQEIQTRGSVMICGNVNPGAQIIAGGSIDIRGTCKGMVHAGAYGDNTAFIVADRLMPTQIRIADRIAQPPEQAEKPTVAERASLVDGKIVIEPIER